MGKIKSKLVKRTSKELVARKIPFTEEFESNKKILGSTMPSKKIRNQMAGYLTRMKKNQAKKDRVLSVPASE